MPPEAPPSGEALWKHPLLQAFGAQAREVAPVMTDSVLAKPLQVMAAALRPTSGADLQEEFSGLRHVGIEVRVALSETEVYLATLLAPVSVVNALLDAGLDAVSVEEGAEGTVLERLRASSAEMVDLLTLMLFTDSPVRGEIGLSAVRLDNIEESVGMVLDAAADAPLYRLDLDGTVGNSAALPITVILPEPLLRGLVRGLSRPPQNAARPAQDDHDTLEAGMSATPGMGSGGGRMGNRPFVLGDHAGDDTDDLDPIPVTPLRFPDLRSSGGPLEAAAPQPLDLILDVSMRVSVELGRSTLTVQEILALGPGSVIELDKLAGEPVDILVNDRLIGRGEVVMVEENFGVRVTEILSPRAMPTAGVRGA